MIRPLSLFCLLAAVGAPAAFAWPNAAVDANDTTQARPANAAAFLKAVKTAPGMVGEILAEDPDVRDPSTLAIDEQGRVYIGETPRFRRGVEDNRQNLFWAMDDVALQTTGDRLKMFEKHAAQKEGGMAYYSKYSDQVTVLEQKGGRWVSKVFAGGFNAPLDGPAGGLFAYKGDIWFSCIPNVWRLRDTDGDLVADERTSVHRGFGVGVSLSGHDLNGFALGFDGRLYFSIGDRGFNFTTPEGRHLVSPNAGAVFRMELDGSKLEVVHESLRNPKEVAFDQWGNLFSVDNDADIGDRPRIVQIIGGGESGWNRGHQSSIMFKALIGNAASQTCLWLGEGWWDVTGTNRPAALLPPSAHLSTGPSGLAYYPGTGFGTAWENHFFLADWNSKGDVIAFRMKAAGAGFALDKETNFLRGVDTPDIEFGYDGRLYVVDMKNGFLTKDDGRLLAFSDPAHVKDAVVLEVEKLFREGIEKLPTARLGELLVHADQRVRLRAELELAARPDGAAVLAAATAPDAPLLKRFHGVCGLGVIARKNADKAAAAKALALVADAAPEVRVRAAEIAGESAALLGREAAFAGLLPALKDADPKVRMYGAMALGKTGDRRAIPALFALLEANADADAYLRHGAVMGLVYLNAPEALVEAAQNPVTAVRRGVLLAMRKMGRAETALFLKDADPTVVREAVQAIHDRKISAAYAALGARLDLLGKFGTHIDNRILFARFAGGQPGDLAALLDCARDVRQPAAVREVALWSVRAWPKPLAIHPVLTQFDPVLAAQTRALSEADRAKVAKGLAEMAQSLSGPLVADLLDTAEQYKADLGQAALERLFADRANPPAARTRVFRALCTAKDAAFLRASLADPQLEVRLMALERLFALEPGPALDLARNRMGAASLRERQQIIALLGKVPLPTAGAYLRELLGQFESQPAELKVDLLEAAAARPEPETKSVAGQIRGKLQAGAAADPLAPYRIALAGGDPLAGRKAFYEHPAAACSRCHSAEPKVGGGNAGPALNLVGAKGPEYLLRALIQPSADFAPGFVPISVTLKGGQAAGGLLMSRGAQGVEFKLADGTVQKVAAADIKEVSEPVSPMPPMSFLSLHDLRDLLAFLTTRTADVDKQLKVKDAVPDAVAARLGAYLDAQPK